MINMYNSPDKGTTLEDGDKRVKFNWLGKSITEGHTLALNELKTKRECLAVSILTANGETEVAFFDKNGTDIVKGDLQSQMRVMQAGGFIKRLSHQGEQNGIKFTQVIYIYDINTDLGVLRQCIKQQV